jgi:phospholipase C
VASNIEHVVLLLLENRSFDHILGDCPNVEGVNSSPLPAHENSFRGKSYRQEPGAGRFVVPDPHHELEHVMVQLAFDESGAPNRGFVNDYGTSYQISDDEVLKEIMRYHQFGSLKALHQLASEFTICDRWHASVPGPTWTNRLFAMSGTSLGRVSMPEGYFPSDLHWYDQPTIFDRLNEAQRTWRVYYHDFPLSFLLVHQREPQNAYYHRRISEFYSDAASRDPDLFPSFAFIEPAYFPPNANDDHPPHDVFGGDALIANVYNALRRNEPLWSKTLLILLFDEHGGFYDHMEPPGCVAPDYHREEYSILQLGVRVPAVLASPWISKGLVCQTVFDHTSLLKYMSDLWGLGYLGERTRNANTFAEILLSAARSDTLPSITSSTSSMMLSAGPPPLLASLTGNQRSILALSHLLEVEANEDPNVVVARSRQLLSGPQAQIDVACDRVEGFIEKQATKVHV